VRIPRRPGVLIAIAAAIGVSLVVVPMHRANAAPTANTVELVINKGGDRNGAQTVAGLAGATFDFIAGTSGTVPPANAVATASCTTDSTGVCHVDVAGRNTGTQGYWIRERTAPSGFSIISALDTGNGDATSSTPYNQLFTGNVANNTTRTFPMAGTGSSFTSRGSSWADERDNPPLPGHCGLNIALLIDTSGSIRPSLPSVKSAANGFVDALTGTPSSIALYRFAADASQLLNSTPVSSTAGADTVKAAINGLTAGGSTNWDLGLFQTAAAAQTYDAIVMLTDGNPTVYGPLATGPGNATRFREVENGIFSANAVKAEGTRVIAVGVGSGVTNAAQNLQSISGPTLDSDYYQADFSELADLFHQLALKTCEGTISVVKDIIPPGGTIADGVPTGGWTFTSSTSGVTPMSGATADGTGAISFTAPLNGASSLPVSLAETQQSGFTLVQNAGKNATCSNGGSPVTVTNAATGPGFTVSALASAIVTCTVYNLAPTPPAQVVVNKEWDINGTHYADGQEPTDFEATLELTGQTNPEFGVTYTNYLEGDSVTVGESVSTLPPGCSNASTGDLGAHTLAAGLNTFSILNTVTCVTTLKLLKSVVNPYGPPENPDSWTLTATPDGGSTPTISGTTGVKEDVIGGQLYDLAESTVPGYKQELVPGAVLKAGETGSWHCVLRLADGSTGSEFDGLNGGVTVALGQNAECTAINTAQPAKLTLKKTVINTNGGTATSTDWTLTATPNSPNPDAKVITGKDGQAAVTGAAAIPLAPYTLTEADGPDNYLQVGDPTCVLTGTTTAADMSGDVVTPGLGQDITCTFTNQDQVVPTTPPPTTPPPTVPPSSPPPLPVTGSSFNTFAGIGSGAFLAGLGLLVVTLRRRRALDD
jgi:Prealbumin-like fold domain/von Willebrand factor type A domain